MSGGKVAGEVTAGSMKGSSPLRWLPLALLAIYAALDCLLQYTLAATDAASILHIPPGVVNFIRVNLPPPPPRQQVYLLIRGIVYSSEALSAHQRHCLLIRGIVYSSEALSTHQRHCLLIRGIVYSSEALSTGPLQ